MIPALTENHSREKFHIKAHFPDKFLWDRIIEINSDQIDSP